MWRFVPESRIQLVSCESSQKYFLGLSTLEEIRDIDLYSFCDSLRSILLSDSLSTFIDLYAQVSTFLNLRSSELSFPNFLC